MFIEYSNLEIQKVSPIVNLGKWMWDARFLYHRINDSPEYTQTPHGKILLMALSQEGRIIPDEDIKEKIGEKYYGQDTRDAFRLLRRTQKEHGVTSLTIYKVFDRGIAVLPILEKSMSYGIQTFTPQKKPKFVDPNWQYSYDFTHTFMTLNEHNTLTPLFTNQQQAFLDLFMNRPNNNVSYNDLLHVIYGDSLSSRLEETRKDIVLHYQTRNRVKSILSKMRKRSEKVGINCEISYLQKYDSYVMNDFSIK